MKRLAVYTSIDGKISTKVINTVKGETYLLKVPQGSVTLQRVEAYSDKLHMKTEIWVEIGKVLLASIDSVLEQAFETYSEDIIYESCIGF